jgi:hypothetical protein
MRLVPETSKVGRGLRRGRGDLLSVRVTWLAAFACAVSLGACASISEKMSEKMATAPGIGEPAATPARVAPTAYPAVHEMPPARAVNLLSDSEQQKMENELVAARDHQQAANPQAAAEVAVARRKAQADEAAAKAKAAANAAKPRVIPNASNGTIY